MFSIPEKLLRKKKILAHFEFDDSNMSHKG